MPVFMRWGSLCERSICVLIAKRCLPSADVLPCPHNPESRALQKTAIVHATAATFL